MITRRIATFCTLALIACFGVTSFTAAGEKKKEVWTDATDPSLPTDFKFQGEYTGTKIGCQIIALGNGAFQAVVCYDGLPGAGWNGKEKSLMDGKLGRLVDPADVQDVRSAILAALGERRSAPNEELQYFSFPQFSKRTAAVVRSLSMSGSAAQIPLTSWGVGARAEAS